MIGLGANVVHGLVIGEHTVIGAGSTVVRDVPDCVVALGSPARVTRTRSPGDRYL
jgi:acetyltransferase-like isoleucine patch superfamily enzyme